MCLNTQKDFQVNTNIGYKILRNVTFAGYVFPYCGKNKIIPLNKWINEKKYRDTRGNYIEDHQLRKYLKGFHIYLNKTSAIKKRRDVLWSRSDYHIVKVEFKHIVAKGVERIFISNSKVVVATQLKVIERYTIK